MSQSTQRPKAVLVKFPMCPNLDHTVHAFDFRRPEPWSPNMLELRAMGVEIIAPPMWMLLDLDAQNNIVASEYAMAACS